MAPPTTTANTITSASTTATALPLPLPFPLPSPTSYNAPSVNTDQFSQILLSHKIVYSGLSGAIATTTIYPLDFCKTQLQNQQRGVARYSGPLDVLRQTLSQQGLRGVYKGYPPNVIFVMPEKAMKLVLNDTFRAQFREWHSRKELTFKAEMGAGALAGWCQSIVTAPMELLKVRGSTAKSASFSYSGLVRSLGVRGLYAGVLSTWNRDLLFSALYFSLYSAAKQRMIASASPQHQNSMVLPLLSGAIAGTIAAAVTCPMDCIKTRVHASAQPAPAGQFWRQEVQMITSKTSELLRHEGPSALFKGIVPRCLIISPLFAVTMFCYEQMQSTFH